MTNMERFIRDHRDDFDNLEPSSRIWEQIESGMNKKNQPAKVVRMTVMKWVVAAAVVVGIFSVSVYFFQQKGSVSGPELAANGKDALVTDIDPQAGKMVAQFSNLIEEKQKEIRLIEKDNPKLYSQFSGDIKKLDSTYQVLRNTLSANPNKEQLLQAMISNLQMQIELLNQQLSIIQKVKHPTREKI